MFFYQQRLAFSEVNQLLCRLNSHLVVVVVVVSQNDLRIANTGGIMYTAERSLKHFFFNMLLFLFKEAEDRAHFAKFHQYTPSFGSAWGKRKGRTLSLLTQSCCEPPEQQKALQREGKSG